MVSFEDNSSFTKFLGQRTSKSVPHILQKHFNFSDTKPMSTDYTMSLVELCVKAHAGM